MGDKRLLHLIFHPSELFFYYLEVDLEALDPAQFIGRYYENKYSLHSCPKLESTYKQRSIETFYSMGRRLPILKLFFSSHKN